MKTNYPAAAIYIITFVFGITAAGNAPAQVFLNNPNRSVDATVNLLGVHHEDSDSSLSIGAFNRSLDASLVSGPLSVESRVEHNSLMDLTGVSYNGSVTTFTRAQGQEEVHDGPGTAFASSSLKGEYSFSSDYLFDLSLSIVGDAHYRVFIVTGGPGGLIGLGGIDQSGNGDLTFNKTGVVGPLSVFPGILFEIENEATSVLQNQAENSSTINFSLKLTPVPDSGSTFGLLGLGALCLAALRRWNW